MKNYLKILGCLFAFCLAAYGQQTGSISGKVVDPSGAALPGVVINAAGDVLPQARTATTDAKGTYRLNLLPPGNYELTFQMTGMATVKKTLRVMLQQNAAVDVAMQPEGTAETMTVMADVPLIDATSAEIKSAIDDDVIEKMPVGQNYKDLIKLVPGVQYTEDAVRGPSAGGSGQDNVYQFDGVNIGLPMYGTLSSEPSTHDIEQIAIVKGGAKATDFNRAGGFTINSISKSGTNTFKGEVSYIVQNSSFIGDEDTESEAEFDKDKDWMVVGLGGPIVKERLFFYASYYAPTTDWTNRSNLYGEVPDGGDDRDEYFFKLSFSPTDSIMLHASYRDSSTDQTGWGVTTDDYAPSLSHGWDTDMTIGILEGDWIINDASSLSFRYTDYESLGTETPDTVFDFPIYADGSTTLDINNLDQMGQFSVPSPIEGETDFNNFIAPIIDQYGYVDPTTGQRMGGGRVGGYYYFDQDDFYRTGYEISYNHFIGGGAISHDLHVGYQWSVVEEDLARRGNGWGQISVPGGRYETTDGTPYYYEANLYYQSFADLTAEGEVPPILHSEAESQNIELNDTMTWNNWTFNVGLMFSHDIYYGQGLQANNANVSGFESAPGNKYEMYDIPFEDQIQPRLGVIWNFNESDTAFANYARYHPEVSSLPRAASWDRYYLTRTVNARFDAMGNLLELDEVRSSSGKFFVPDMEPRQVDEYTIGFSKQFPNRLTLKTYARHRYGCNFWEDTNNNARARYGLGPDGEMLVPTLDDYLPELGDYRAEIGGSSYVIARLDGAFTKFYEVNVDAEWRGDNVFLKGSYVWSHYYGNFDQDNTSSYNDASRYIGSSLLSDGAGRQHWNNQEGNLRGDRRHQLKLFGYYDFTWNGNAGVYAIYQSGQPWAPWDRTPYVYLTEEPFNHWMSSSNSTRFAEPAGSRTSGAHYQFDLNYTHFFQFANRYILQLRVDLFNVLDNQTGYNIQPDVLADDYSEDGTPRDWFFPRRFQLSMKFKF